MKFILGTKEYMTQLFDEKGVCHPVTVVSTGPSTVTQVKNKENDGYSAVQFGWGEKKESRTAKAQIGHVKAAREKNTELKDRKSTRLNSSHSDRSRMPSSA